LFEQDPEQLASLTHAELAKIGGVERAEERMSLTMRSALSAQVFQKTCTAAGAG
jgi:gallate dioxygenase